MVNSLPFQELRTLVRESLLAPPFAGIPSREPLELMERRMGILPKVGTR